MELLILTHDLVDRLDRRIVNEARIFVERGWQVRIVLTSMEDDPRIQALEKGILLDPVAVSKCVPPHDPIYHGTGAGTSTQPTLTLKQKLKWTLAQRLRSYPRAFETCRNWWNHGENAMRKLTNQPAPAPPEWYPLPFTTTFAEHGKNRRPDAIMACDLPALPPAYELAQRWRVPLIYDSHELYVEQNVFTARQKRVMEYHEHWFTKAVDLFITVAPRIAQEFQAKYGLIEIPKVVYNSPSFQQRPENEASAAGRVRAKLNIPPGAPVLMYHGGLVRNRNLERLLHGFAKLDAPDAYLVFLGYGDHTAPLMKLAERHGKGRILVCDAVPQDELPDWLRDADAVVIPYPATEKNNEFALPNKLFDCIDLGVPVVANESLRSVRDILEAHRLGIVGPMDSHRGMSLTLSASLAWLRSEQRKQADFATARELFGWGTQTKHLCQWFEILGLPGFGSKRTLAA